jgi:CBS domain-containing protein
LLSGTSEEGDAMNEQAEPVSRAGRTQDHFVSDTIRDVMSPQPRVVEAGATVLEAAQVMHREDIGDVLVLETDRPCGILTDRDIVVRVLAEGKDPSTTRVSEVCSRELTTVGPDDSVGQAVRLMREKAIRRLPVMERGEIVGMLTIGDIAVARDSRTALADISAAPPNR